MFMACGVAAYSAGIFHLMTHAFFKALLFLAAGSVIHALGGEQDMRRMGGLYKLIPVTFWTMTVATFTIAGFFPLAGFFSKDEILAREYGYPFGGHLFWTIAWVTAGLTSFYMFRLWFMTFFGEPRWSEGEHSGDSHATASKDKHGAQPPPAATSGHSTSHDAHARHVHESPRIMLVPLVILAIGSVVSGWIGVPAFLGGHDEIDEFLKPAIQTPADISVTQPGAAALHDTEKPESNTMELALASASIAAASLGLFFAWLFYYKKRDLPERITAKIQSVYLTVLHKYYVDEAYGAIFVKPLLALSTYVLWKGIDQSVIDGLVNGAGETSQDIGNQLRRIQSGNIRSYAAWIAAGGAVVVVYMLWHNLAGVSK
jgi:NADH-quinone oxidoreductase subunit L